MELIDLLHVGVRWGHALAAVVWVGGSLFYLLTLNPALALLGDFPERRALLGHIGRQFQEVVSLAILIFVLTGVVLTVDRLTQPTVTVAYVLVLGVKIAFSLWMFWLAQQLRRHPGPAGVRGVTAQVRLGRDWLQSPNLLLALGLVVYLLAEVLKVLFERSIVGV